VYVFPHEPGQAPRDPVAFKGEFLYGKAKKLLKFIGSPSITSIEAANKLGLTLNDFAVHDPMKDMLFMADAGGHSDLLSPEIGASSRASKTGKNNTAYAPKILSKKPSARTAEMEQNRAMMSGKSLARPPSENNITRSFQLHIKSIIRP
jgi:hypothetical protein